MPVKLKHVPVLDSAATYPEWKRHISQVLVDEGLWGHVEGSTAAHAVHPVLPQPSDLNANSDDATIAAFNTWWKDDNRALDIVTRRISRSTYGSTLTLKDDTTARSVWEDLRTKYALVRVDVAALFVLKEELLNLRLKDYSDVDTYIGRFRAGRERLLAIGVAYPEVDMVHDIIRGLPCTSIWQHFKQLMVQLMHHHLDAEAHAKEGNRVPDTLLNRVIQRITLECHRLSRTYR